MEPVLNQLTYLESIAKDLDAFYTAEQVIDKVVYIRDRIARYPNHDYWAMSLTSSLPYIPNVNIVLGGENFGFSSFSCSTMEQVEQVRDLMNLLSGGRAGAMQQSGQD